MKPIIPTNVEPFSPASDDSSDLYLSTFDSDSFDSDTFCVEKLQAAIAGNPADLGILPAFRAVRSQFDIHVFKELTSTNAKLWDMLASGAPAGTVAIAKTQTAGRGQRGRVWQSSSGGLYLSLALEPDWPATHIAQLTCISAWGIATAFNQLGIPIKVKWPNDLFFEGKKLGGILTETKLSYAHSDFAPVKNTLSSTVPRAASLKAAGLKPTPYVKQAVVGVGLNGCNSVPETAITLREILALLPAQTGKNKINCLEMLAALVLKGILQGYLFQQRVGSQDFMKAYSDLLTQVGDVVSLESDWFNRAFDPEGALKRHLQDNARQLEKCSGEVVGVSEEGYLKVALRDIPATLANDLRKVSSDTLSSGSLDKSPGCITDILLIRPAGL